MTIHYSIYSMTMYKLRLFLSLTPLKSIKKTLKLANKIFKSFKNNHI